MIIDCSLLDSEVCLIVFKITVESFYILRCRRDRCTCVASKYNLIEIVCQRKFSRVVDNIGSKECDAPCTTFTSCLHDRDR